ncbi:flagellar biosynthesis anti-sigma factor FlgM [Granulosicoccaceae sp. 1_MG-2023]|nr:flagellar biosynthesis anti-sigma factor FlgM [Granulosicoccaceae sp. 1_MG-2023]
MMADPVTSLSELRKVHAVRATTSPAAATTQTGHASAPEDTLDPTNTLLSIESLSSALAKGEQVDQQRIDEIRTRIESGNYQLNADRVARKFLELEQLLSNT